MIFFFCPFFKSGLKFLINTDFYEVLVLYKNPSSIGICLNQSI